MAVHFVDRVTISVAAGDGGNGCASVHREKFKPLGGPDGGNGGRGGDVILRVDPSVTTLLDFHYHPHRAAGKGRPGAGGNRSGAVGEDLVIAVPDGTVVSTTNGAVLADLVGAGTSVVLAAGGRGGLGNAALASSRRKAPGFALRGEAGQSAQVVLELKTLADVGLVGFPSAGKSSLIASVSAARPEIADYPFTTLTPNLGVVQAGDVRFTMADVPGLIPGASEGKGLGLEFLRHIERCSALVHVVDCASLEPGRDPLSDIDAIEAELSAYGGLADRPRVVALNKVDVPDAAELAEMVTPELQARGLQVFAVSAATGAGIKQLLFALAQIVTEHRQSMPIVEATRIVLRPVAVDEEGFDVRRSGDRFIVTGPRPERWVAQTDFTNAEAVGYLGDRLARLGVEKRLVELGADPGAEVVIGTGDDAVVFDWEPTIVAGAEHLLGRRGEDLRLEDW